MDVAAALTTLALIVPVELPDKTFVATLVLATRYRPLLVWIGVGLAFLVQTLVAVTAGGLLARLPHRPVVAVAALLFMIGGLVLLRGAAGADSQAQSEAELAGEVRPGTTGLRAVGASFGVLFLAEWGDLSQLLTAGMVVRTRDPVSVFVGAWIGLLLVSGLGAVLGRALIQRVRLSTIRRLGGGICLLLAVVSGLQALGVDPPV